MPTFCETENINVKTASHSQVRSIGGITASFVACLVALALPCVAAPENPAQDPPAKPANAEQEPTTSEPSADSPKEKPEDPLAKHRKGSVKLAEEQDELNADVQQLVLEQTDAKVIGLLEEVEGAMDDAIDRLEEHDTGGQTIAAQTDVIEKIYQAAKQKQKGGGSSTGSAMMDMLGNMMGKGEKAGKKGKGKNPGEQSGEGMTGESDSANQSVAGAADGKKEERRVPKASGTTGRPIPTEFRDALDAFNRGAEEMSR